MKQNNFLAHTMASLLKSNNQPGSKRREQQAVQQKLQHQYLSQSTSSAIVSSLQSKGLQPQVNGLNSQVTSPKQHALTRPKNSTAGPPTLDCGSADIPISTSGKASIVPTLNMNKLTPSATFIVPSCSTTMNKKDGTAFALTQQNPVPQQQSHRQVQSRYPISGHKPSYSTTLKSGQLQANAMASMTHRQSKSSLFSKQQAAHATQLVNTMKDSAPQLRRLQTNALSGAAPQTTKAKASGPMYQFGSASKRAAGLINKDLIAVDQQSQSKCQKLGSTKKNQLIQNRDSFTGLAQSSKQVSDDQADKAPQAQIKFSARHSPRQNQVLTPVHKMIPNEYPSTSKGTTAQKKEIHMINLQNRAQTQIQAEVNELHLLSLPSQIQKQQQQKSNTKRQSRQESMNSYLTKSTGPNNKGGVTKGSSLTRNNYTDTLIGGLANTPSANDQKPERQPIRSARQQHGAISPNAAVLNYGGTTVNNPQSTQFMKKLSMGVLANNQASASPAGGNTITLKSVNRMRNSVVGSLTGPNAQHSKNKTKSNSLASRNNLHSLGTSEVHSIKGSFAQMSSHATKDQVQVRRPFDRAQSITTGQNEQKISSLMSKVPSQPGQGQGKNQPGSQFQGSKNYQLENKKYVQSKQHPGQVSSPILFSSTTEKNKVDFASLQQREQIYNKNDFDQSASSMAQSSQDQDQNEEKLSVQIVQDYNLNAKKQQSLTGLKKTPQSSSMRAILSKPSETPNLKGNVVNSNSICAKRQNATSHAYSAMKNSHMLKDATSPSASQQLGSGALSHRSRTSKIAQSQTSHQQNYQTKKLKNQSNQQSKASLVSMSSKTATGNQVRKQGSIRYLDRNKALLTPMSSSEAKNPVRSTAILKTSEADKKRRNRTMRNNLIHTAGTDNSSSTAQGGNNLATVNQSPFLLSENDSAHLDFEQFPMQLEAIVSRTAETLSNYKTVIDSLRRELTAEKSKNAFLENQLEQAHKALQEDQEKEQDSEGSLQEEEQEQSDHAPNEVPQIIQTMQQKQSARLANRNSAQDSGRRLNSRQQKKSLTQKKSHMNF